MHLSESQISIRESEFLDLVEFVTKEVYTIDESYAMSEEDEVIVEALMAYFVENYKEATMAETCATISGTKDVNEDLYIEIVEAMLDESLGSFVAGAVHGVGNILAKRRAASATNTSVAASGKSKNATTALNTHNASGKSGILHNLKGAFLKAKSDKTREIDASKASAARDSNSAARISSAKRSGLANKIDTHLANAKKKVKDAVTNAATAAASHVGKLAGAM